MSGFAPKHRRNRRRTYDENGCEIAPPTLGQMRAEGETTASITCEACGRSLIVSTDGLPDETPFPDIVIRLRCSRCGSTRITAMKDMLAYYDRCYRAGHPGGGGALPESYRIEAWPFLK